MGIIITIIRITQPMSDPFFIRALLAGIGIVLVTGPVGCQIVWQRMAYFGDTVAHSALLGISIALLAQVHLSVGAFIAAAIVALSLVWFGRQRGLPSDALLGILAHGSLATGLVMVSLIDGARVDLVNVLFGDILAVSDGDIVMIYAVATAVLLLLAVIWRPLLAATVNQEIAAAEGQRTELVRFGFLLLVAAVVAIAVKIVGVLLLTAMLIIPAATARRFAGSPEAMALISVLVGVAAVLCGLLLSLHLDSPSGPSIVLAATVFFLVSHSLRRRQSPPRPERSANA